MSVRSRLAAVLRVGALVLAGLVTVLTVTLGQDLGPAPVVLRVGEAASQTFIAPARVSVVDLAATETARSEAAAQVEDLYRIDTQVTETVLEFVADVFATVGEVAKPVLPPGTTTTTTTLADTTSTSAPGATTSTTADVTTTTIPAEPMPRTEQILVVAEAYPLLDDLTVASLVDLVNGDPGRVEAGDTELFRWRQEAVDIANEYLQRGSRCQS
jgi:membrane-associated HD superfamily phosphohydrolase